jgi:hypothetical protein
MKPSDPEGVLNGIAYDAQHDRLFVTGKEWPLIFEIKVKEIKATETKNAPKFKTTDIKTAPNIKTAPKPVR